MMKILRIFGLIIMQSLTFIAQAINRFCNRRPPSIPEMAAPDNVAAAAAAHLPADADKPMEVDVGYMDLICPVVQHSGTTRNDLLRAAGREPGEDPTVGDMIRLGHMFCDRVVLSTDPLLVARQLDAEKDATRRRNEMAAKTDHSDEYNDLYNELYSLESCVPPDNKHMGKQISTLAAKMREKKRLGGLKMDSAADWIRSRQELEETFRDARLGSNNIAKCWLAFEVASPSTQTNLTDAGNIKVLQNSPTMADYNKHFVQPQNYCFKVLSTSANARNSLHRQRPQRPRRLACQRF